MLVVHVICEVDRQLGDVWFPGAFMLSAYQFQWECWYACYEVAGQLAGDEPRKSSLRSHHFWYKILFHQYLSSNHDLITTLKISKFLKPYGGFYISKVESKYWSFFSFSNWVDTLPMTAWEDIAASTPLKKTEKKLSKHSMYLIQTIRPKRTQPYPDQEVHTKLHT